MIKLSFGNPNYHRNNITMMDNESSRVLIGNKTKRKSKMALQMENAALTRLLAKTTSHNSNSDELKTISSSSSEYTESNGFRHKKSSDESGCSGKSKSAESKTTQESEYPKSKRQESKSLVSNASLESEKFLSLINEFLESSTKQACREKCSEESKKQHDEEGIKNGKIRETETSQNNNLSSVAPEIEEVNDGTITKNLNKEDIVDTDRHRDLSKSIKAFFERVSNSS